MKNIIKYIILLIILMPINIYADMGAPIQGNMNGHISNTAGASIYEFDFNKSEYVKTNDELPYNAEIYVLPESTKMYLITKCEYEFCKTESKYIKKEDASILNNGKLDKENFKVENYNKSKKFIVYNEGAYLLNAPFKGSGKIKENIMLPPGTIFESNLYDELYVYVEYNGYNGYLFIYNNGTFGWEKYADEPIHVIPFEEEEAYTANKITIYKDIEYKEILGTLEPNQKITLLYKNGFNQFIKYNDTIGVIQQDETHKIASKFEHRMYFQDNWITSENNYFLALEDINLLEYCDPQSSIIGKINKDEIIESPYISNIHYFGIKGGEYFSSDYCIKLKDKEGWIFTPNNNSENGAKVYHLNHFTIKKEINLVDENSKILETIPAEKYSDIKSIAKQNGNQNYTFEAVYDNQKGYITVSINDIRIPYYDGFHEEPINTEPEIKEEEQPVVEEEKPNEVIPSENKKEEEKEVIKEEGLTRYNIVILAVAGTVVLALLMLVIIKLINRNKKVKEARSTSINRMSNNIIEIIIPNTENITNDKTGENK